MSPGERDTLTPSHDLGEPGREHYYERRSTVDRNREF